MLPTVVFHNMCSVYICNNALCSTVISTLLGYPLRFLWRAGMEEMGTRPKGSTVINHDDVYGECASCVDSKNKKTGTSLVSLRNVIVYTHVCMV